MPKTMTIPKTIVENIRERNEVVIESIIPRKSIRANAADARTMNLRSVVAANRTILPRITTVPTAAAKTNEDDAAAATRKNDGKKIRPKSPKRKSRAKTKRNHRAIDEMKRTIKHNQHHHPNPNPLDTTALLNPRIFLACNGPFSCGWNKSRA